LETVNISFDIESSDAACPLGVEIWLDDLCIYQSAHVKQLHKIEHAIDDDNEGEHELRIVMSGKTSEHTKIDNHGNILKDAVLQISNAIIDGIDVAQLFNEKCVYVHDFNGTQPEINDEFFGIMGCNGTLHFKFSTPIYLWLLEHM
jgi:hypothetical protein